MQSDCATPMMIGLATERITGWLVIAPSKGELQ